jgi:CubicO group peptidase (beta-lactamase class C family)
VLALRGDEVLLSSASGVADPGSGLPCAAGTRFQIASVSKQFTAAAVLVMVDQGRIALDDPVNALISGCPPSWDAITLRHLLTHTSGLGHWEDYPEVDLVAWREPDAVIQAFQGQAPLFEPGERFAYSSPGYVLLAHVVQRAADQPYRSFLAERIFEPLGMIDTFVGAGAGRPTCAVGLVDGEPTPSFELDAVGMGAGDVWSTVADLVRWDQALASGELLSQQSREATFAHQVWCGDDATDVWYGFGWILGSLAGQPGVRYHTGQNAGFRALNVWLPLQDVRFAALTNDEATDPHAMPDVLRRVLSG